MARGWNAENDVLLDAGTRRWAAFAMLAAVVVGAGGLWLTSSDAIRPSDGTPGGATVLAMGETFYVGQPGLAKRPVVVTSIEPVVTSGLSARSLLCHRDETYKSILQGGNAGDINDACRKLEPVTRPITVQPDVARTYVVVEVTRVAPGPQRICGVDIRYRDGWRWGRARLAGEDVVFDGSNLEDPDHWPACSS